MNDLEIIYEDNHLIAINKPNGLLVHTDDTGDTSLEQMKCLSAIVSPSGPAGEWSFDFC